MLMSRLVWVLLHPATFLVASTALMIGLGGALWQQHGAQITAATRTTTEAMSVRITPSAPAVVAGIDREVTDRLRQIRQPLEQTDAVETFARALLAMGPVERVHRVRKSRSGIEIDCRWREPVAAVRTTGGVYRLVDREGVVFDRPLRDEEARLMLCISVNGPGGDRLAAWQTWDDPRVVAAAAIADQIADSWREWGVYRVVTFRNPPGYEPNIGAYLLWTAASTRIIWSDRGGVEPAELVQRRKDAISRWIQANGPLDSLAGKMMLDVRSGSVQLIPEQRGARLPDWLDNLK